MASAREAPEVWLRLCREAVGRVDAALEKRPLTADRESTTGRGEGGDRTLVIDAEAESAIIDTFGEGGHPVTVVSEERGDVELAGGGGPVVIIDPIDGSLNAKRRIPLYGISIAVADGPSMEDVRFGFVHDLERGEEWWAATGAGAHLDGERLALSGEGELEVLGVESANPKLVAGAAPALAASGAHRLRILGSIALSMCFVAGGRFDGMLSLWPSRSVDAAAAQLVAREAGAAVAFSDTADGRLGAGVDLGMRSRVLAARDERMLERLVALGAGEPRR